MTFYENTLPREVSRGEVLLGGLVSFSVGVLFYPWIEILYRGYTHISMALAGGLAMAFLYVLAFFPLSRASKMFLGALFVLILELNIGLICNMVLKLNVWDYGNLPLSFCGQISFIYAVFWFFLCLPFSILAEKLALLLWRLKPTESRPS